MNKENVIEKIRAFVTFAAFAFCAALTVHFHNAGNSYLQAVSFRGFVLSFGVALLMQLEIKEVFNLWNLVYLPCCYVFMHFAYKNQWIADVCEYKFVSVIRLAKLIALVWGIVCIALTLRLLKRIKEKGVPRIKDIPLWWLLFAACITVFNPGYTNALFYPICLSCAFYIMKDEDARVRMYRGFMQGQIVILILFSVFSLVYRPYDADERYRGYFSNSNAAGEYLAVCFLVMFVLVWKTLFFEKKKSRIRLVFYTALLLWSGVLVFFNYTRTVIAGLLCAVFFFLLLTFIRKEGKKLIKPLLIYLLLQLLVLYPGYLCLRYIPAYICRPRMLYGEQINESKIVAGDPVDSDKYISLQEFLTLAFGKWGIYVKFDVPEREEQTEAVVVDTERDVTNGRTEIWAAFIQRLEFAGHYPGHIYLKEKDGEDKLIYHAHNSYLQVFYQYGALTEIAFVLMVIFSVCVPSYAYLKKRESSAEQAAYIMMSVLMAVAMMTEWLWHPAYSMCFAYMFIYGMQINDKKRKKVKDNGFV